MAQGLRGKERKERNKGVAAWQPRFYEVSFRCLEASATPGPRNSRDGEDPCGKERTLFRSFASSFLFLSLQGSSRSKSVAVGPGRLQNWLRKRGVLGCASAVVAG